MSPSQGRRPTAGKGGGGGASGPSGPAATRRLGLLLFGVAFIALFAIIALADGIGHPSIPSGDVMLIEDVPGDAGSVSQADFDRALEQTAAQGGQKKVPKPGEAQYEELKETTLRTLIQAAWIEGEAEETGITVTDKEVAEELAKLKKESFKNEAEFKKFVKEVHFTPADVNRQVTLRVLSARLEAQLKEKGGQPPSSSEIEDYYSAAKATQFTQKASVDVRVVVNKNRQKAEEAKAQLEKDNSAKSWQKVAKKYSEDPTSKESGGQRKGVQEGVTEEPLDALFFDTPEGKIEGPINTQQGYTVFEVEGSTPESAQPLKAVEGQIKSQLSERSQQEYVTTFLTDFTIKWRSRTFCAAGFVTENCANFESDGHPSNAPPACYEANPKGGLPEACPAPVFQLVPAQPGSVSVLEPQGKPLTQRPVPAGGKVSEEAAAGVPGEGGVPPGEAPPEEAPPGEAPPEEAPPGEAPPEEAPPQEAPPEEAPSE